MDDDQLLRDRLAELVADEPPFGTALGPALAAAEQRGRRRRGRRSAIRMATVAVACAAATVAALALANGGSVVLSPTPVRPASRSLDVSTPSVTSSATSTTAPGTLGTESALRRLLREVAAETGGEARIARDDSSGEPWFTARVATAAGPVEIAAAVEPNPDGVAEWRGSCRLEASGSGGVTCRTLLDRAEIGAWDTEHADHPGRRNLKVAAATPDGGTLTVNIDNLLEDGGLKQVGPDWERSGITVEGILAAIAASGLAMPVR